MGCPEIEALVKYWNYIHKATSRALKVAPQEKFDYQPKPDMMSLGKLVHHFAQAEQVLVRTALVGTFQKIELNLDGKSPDEIAEIFDAKHNELMAEVSELSAEQLPEQVEFAGHQLRRIDLLRATVEHEIHHRGQLYTYLHLVDVTPPPLH